MNESRHDAGQDISIGVLIIGSLIWDTSDPRAKWRKHLDLDAKRHVHTPIRYGRKSGSRGDSYTMVFSMSLVHEERFGRAIVVPCRQSVKDTDGLVEEAERLWTAERNSDTPNRRISARKGWGCVGLLTNPDRPIPNVLCAGWTKRVSRELHCYRQLNSTGGEQAVVAESGFLNIPWPSTEDGLDLGIDVLLATATKPTIDDGGYYPSPCEVADAWNTHDGKKSVEYFVENRAHGIETFQDGIIEERLRELRQ